jgi:NAD(P)-dependent dehydrogenase (short-subunit alcohol dehydrogenase family)
MNPTTTALRAGWSRGLIELRQSLTNGGDLFNHFFWPVLMLVTLFFMRDVTFGQSGFMLGTLVLPSILGMNAAMAMVTMSQLLTADREDGTTPTGADFHPLRTYADTKLCNLLLVSLFAKRWEDAGVTINAVHPGVIRTGLGDRAGLLGLLLKAVKLFWKSPEAGARPVVRLAREADVAGVTGRYFDTERELRLAPVARDVALAQRLWAQAMELTGHSDAPRPSAPHVA